MAGPDLTRPSSLFTQEIKVLLLLSNNYVWKCHILAIDCYSKMLFLVGENLNIFLKSIHMGNLLLKPGLHNMEIGAEAWKERLGSGL